jgi:D-alanyl-D-alanine carboxypeptidase
MANVFRMISELCNILDSDPAIPNPRGRALPNQLLEILPRPANWSDEDAKTWYSAKVYSDDGSQFIAGLVAQGHTKPLEPRRIDRDDFALDCNDAASARGVSAVDLLAIADYLSGVKDTPQQGSSAAGPLLFTEESWAIAMAAAPELKLTSAHRFFPAKQLAAMAVEVAGTHKKFQDASLPAPGAAEHTFVRLFGRDSADLLIKRAQQPGAADTPIEDVIANYCMRELQGAVTKDQLAGEISSAHADLLGPPGARRKVSEVLQAVKTALQKPLQDAGQQLHLLQPPDKEPLEPPPPPPVHGTITWPRDNQDALIAFYGNPGSAALESQLVPVVPPFRMTYEGKPIGSIKFHQKAAGALLAALNEIWEAYGKDQSKIDAAGISRYDGAYNPRKIRGSAKWSNHAFGAAIDINARENGFGTGHGTMPQIVVDAFKRQGARWGGDYKHRTDPMHFEFCGGGRAAAQPTKQQPDDAFGPVTPAHPLSAGGQIYFKLLTKFRQSSVVGVAPSDGAQFGITTGTAEQWATFGTACCDAESGFNPRSANTSDPGGSFGIFQYAHNQVPGGNAFDVDASVAAFVRDAESSVESGSLRHGILGRRFSTIGQHPSSTIAKLAEAAKLAAEAQQSAPPDPPAQSPHR